jgi:hypothetical protein
MAADVTARIPALNDSALPPPPRAEPAAWGWPSW